MAPGPSYTFATKEVAGQFTGDRLVIDHTGQAYRIAKPGEPYSYVMDSEGRIRAA